MQPIRQLPVSGSTSGSPQIVLPRNQANARIAPSSPLRVAIGAPRRKAGRNRRRGLERLLIERLAASGELLAEALGADGPEASLTARSAAS